MCPKILKIIMPVDAYNASIIEGYLIASYSGYLIFGLMVQTAMGAIAITMMMVKVSIASTR